MDKLWKTIYSDALSKEAVDKKERAFKAALAYEINCRAKYDSINCSKPPIKGERMIDYAYRYNTTVEEMKHFETQVDSYLKI